MSLTEEQQAKILELRAWTKADRDAQVIVAQTMARHRVTSTAQLAEDHPDLFDELHDVIESMLDDIPTRNDPFFTR